MAACRAVVACRAAGARVAAIPLSGERPLRPAAPRARAGRWAPGAEFVAKRIPPAIRETPTSARAHPVLRARRVTCEAYVVRRRIARISRTPASRCLPAIPATRRFLGSALRGARAISALSAERASTAWILPATQRRSSTKSTSRLLPRRVPPSISVVRPTPAIFRTTAAAGASRIRLARVKPTASRAAAKARSAAITRCARSLRAISELDPSSVPAEPLPAAHARSQGRRFAGGLALVDFAGD